MSIIRTANFQLWNPEQTNSSSFRLRENDYQVGQNEYQSDLDEIPEEFRSSLLAGDIITETTDTFGEEAGLTFWFNESKKWGWGRWKSMSRFIGSFV
jgi:hypothetical protein